MQVNAQPAGCIQCSIRKRARHFNGIQYNKCFFIIQSPPPMLPLRILCPMKFRALFTETLTDAHLETHLEMRFWGRFRAISEGENSWSRNMADGPRHNAQVGRGSHARAALGLQIIKQYPRPEQVELKVVADVPGSWFGGTLNTNERCENCCECYRAAGARLGDLVRSS